MKIPEDCFSLQVTVAATSTTLIIGTGPNYHGWTREDHLAVAG